jgi:hypothetical protein
MASPNQEATGKQEAQKNYKGFVAGVFSGVSKLTGKFITRDIISLT